MPTTILPRWPHILFAILEPLSLIGGWLYPLLNLPSFITDQIPNTPALDADSIPRSSIALAYQLSNLYGLLCLLGVATLYSTREPAVLRNYLLALAIADVGHVYVTGLAMGWDAFVDVAGWNVLTWGNVGVTAFLFGNRVLYFLGVFGSPSPPVEEDRKRV
ncbi:hypothetical protein ATEIFO6365_0010026700 [Aspergillus terreus]|uniref:DUF7704 domain-containing protein n=1 Tax=Aspergillus terreus TaxID=33178 RepID=A0A5M3ZDP9_ASPTE|nr:hypothetical protein ATETN484_0012024600 [Aspergillus terreus]GFF19494.1 hypothetical protein ATEIFO6365_0010026700 [Aspergillus terreus]